MWNMECFTDYTLHLIAGEGMGCFPPPRKIKTQHNVLTGKAWVTSTFVQNGDTALIVSARNDDTELVEILLDSGANPNAQGEVRLCLHLICNRRTNKSLHLLHGYIHYP